ncbi:MAG: hypothetical protein CK425_00885 [Parachlamydia sp.]|nr:MAG: hypothetical protein CK425_00885 [Parachlamydia sp.]
MGFKSLIIGLLMMQSFTSFAHPMESAIPDEVTLEQIFMHGDDCVRNISNNKIYLKEDNIFLIENETCLLLNQQGNVVRIPLNSDELGFFVSVSIYKDCPGCGKPYFAYCKNVDCPLKKRKK